MSYDAIRWAWEQDVKPAMRKLVLLAMADCVNAESGEMVCWPSYAHLSRRTGMNTKTVEAGVYQLKQEGYIVDTGKRAGDTGKVVVYRLNDPKTGGITPGPQIANANGTRPQNTTENGVIGQQKTAELIPPNPASNPPKNDGQSPQKVEETTPKTGVVIRKGTRNGTRKEPGTATAAAAAILTEVPAPLLHDWLVVRKDKRAGPITETVAAGLRREAKEAGISVETAVRCCCEAGWQGFNAAWYRKRTAEAGTPTRGGRSPGDDWTGSAT